MNEIVCSVESTSLTMSNFTCPVCACAVADDEKQHICETCSTPHHKDCWEYAGGCAIFGCRKGVVRKASGSENLKEIIAPVNMRIMAVWGWFFRIHWLTFLIAASGVIGTAIIGTFLIVGTLVLPALPVYWPAMISFLRTLYFLLLFPALAIPLGAVTYLFLVPAAIVMRIHFHTINLTLPSGNSAVAKSIADRVDMPATVQYVKRLNQILSKICEYLVIGFIVSSVFAFLSTVVPVHAFLIGALVLLLVKQVLLPLFGAAFESRVTILVTFQNRLIASAKKSKGE